MGVDFFGRWREYKFDDFFSWWWIVASFFILAGTELGIESNPNWTKHQQRDALRIGVRRYQLPLVPA